MKKAQIEVGKTYHNGKKGNRSYSARKVLEIVLTTFGWNVRFEQVAGRYKGEKATITQIAFASWAKGEVTDK